MNISRTLHSLLVVSGLVLGTSLAVRADVDPYPGETPAAPVTSPEGLLGQKHATLTYSYVNLDDSSTHADDYRFASNIPLAFGLDGLLSYDYSRSGQMAGNRMTSHTFAAGLRAFSSQFNWGKPYLEAGGGFAQARFAGTKDDSVVWTVAGGVEFQLRPATSLTPYIRYYDAPDLAGSGTTTFGAKLNHWVNTQWAVTAGLDIDDDRNTTFTVGTNFRF
ncbi:MAG TPA: hypothetical protein VG734_23535 [Lacunisphaera sp.]|nr:hypothetical protein [Lacunisphaera sp.]